MIAGSPKSQIVEAVGDAVVREIDEALCAVAHNHPDLAHAGSYRIGADMTRGSMTLTEFESRRSSLLTILNQRVGQSNWRMVSEVCADLLDLEGEWRLSQPSEPQRISGKYAPVVEELNARSSR